MMDCVITIDDLGFSLYWKNGIVDKFIIEDPAKAEQFRREFIADNQLAAKTTAQACAFQMLDQAIKECGRPEGIWPWLGGG